MMSRRFLINGANGAIGSAICRYLLAAGHHVWALHRPGADLVRLKEGCGDLKFQAGDVFETGYLTGLIEALKPDVIVNCAFPSGHFQSDPHQGAVLQVVQALVQAFVDAVRATGFDGEFISLGSATVYGSGPAPFRVEQALQPIVTRGVYKAVESILFGQGFHGLPARFSELRIFTSYGPYEQSQRFIASLMRAGLGGQKVSLTAEPARRDWIFNGDIAAAVEQLSLRPVTNSDFVFNLCTGLAYSTHEVAQLCSEIIGAELIDDAPYPSSNNYPFKSSGTLPQADLWQPQTSLLEGLQATWRWAQTQEGRAYLLADDQGGRSK